MTLEQAVKTNPYNPDLGTEAEYIRYLRYNVDGFHGKSPVEVRDRYLQEILRQAICAGMADGEKTLNR